MLPRDILGIIFDYISVYNELVRLKKVCKAFRDTRYLHKKIYLSVVHSRYFKINDFPCLREIILIQNDLRYIPNIIGFSALYKKDVTLVIDIPVYVTSEYFIFGSRPRHEGELITLFTGEPVYKNMIFNNLIINYFGKFDLPKHIKMLTINIGSSLCRYNSLSDERATIFNNLMSRSDLLHLTINTFYNTTNFIRMVSGLGNVRNIKKIALGSCTEPLNPSTLQLMLNDLVSLFLNLEEIHLLFQPSTSIRGAYLNINPRIKTIRLYHESYDQYTIEISRELFTNIMHARFMNRNIEGHVYMNDAKVY
jgi:hypothetical protein